MIWLKASRNTLLTNTLNRWVLIRATLLTLMYLTLYAVIPFVPLSILAAGFYTGPIFIVILSALLIGEPVTRANWIAVFIGFSGVLISLDLFADSFSLLAIVPVLSGLFYALAAIVTRSKCHDHKPLSLALALAGVLGLTGILMSTALMWASLDALTIEQSPFMLGPWAPMDLNAWGLIILLAVLLLGIGILLATAYQVASPAIVASFDYSYLIFAAIFGFMLFSETPNLSTVLGMALIAGAGIFSAKASS